jgi:hypothetical protein
MDRPQLFPDEEAPQATWGRHAVTPWCVTAQPHRSVPFGRPWP